MPQLDGVPAKGYTAAQITDLAMRAEDPLCVETTTMFCAMLGTMAGNLALTLGARGGVYIGGGIVPKLGRMFLKSPFRERFEAKGRFRSYLKTIPTFVVTHPLPAFLGCAALLAQVANYEALSTGAARRPRVRSAQGTAASQTAALSPNQTMPIAATTAVPTPDHTA